jgi:hypothetical protein
MKKMVGPPLSTQKRWRTLILFSAIVRYMYVYIYIYVDKVSPP